MKRVVAASGELVTRLVGECQICERRIKVHGQSVVLHGYRRPGYGSVEGRCGGEGHLAYEISCAQIPPWLEGVKAQLKAQRAVLAKIKANKVVCLAEHRRATWPEQGYVEVQFALGVTALPVWEAELEAFRRRTARDVELLEKDAKRLQGRIDDWKLRTLQKVDERGRTAADREAAEDRKAERDAKRAAKKEKRDALDAKAAARRLARQTLLDEAAVKIRASAVEYAASLQDAGPRDDALAVMRELGKKKHQSLLEHAGSYDWETDLKCDDALLALDLAWTSASAYRADRVTYKHKLWRKS